MRHKHLFILITTIIGMMILSACGGLAGEPEIVGQMPTQSAPVAVNLQPPSIAPDLAVGAEIFAENCVRCHGEIGAGDGEFVQSGQVTDIPNFTDPAQHTGRTAQEYYLQVTNGNLEKLMPPFSGSLTDEERWSVANYVLTLAGGEIPETTSETETTESESPHSTTAEGEIATASVSGTILQGTAGASIPESGTVTLTIIEMTGAQGSLETELNADGTYLFDNLPLISDAGYFVSIDYGNGTFNSEFAPLTETSPDINLNITIYETTDDDSVIQLEVVLSQVDVLDEQTLQIWQLISVVNTSDKVYIYIDDRGESVSVEVPAPEGVRLSPEIDLSRFSFNDNAVFDTRPVVPNTEHSFQLLYTVPFNGSATFSQTFPYAFLGPYEAYVDSSQLRLNADGWQTLDTPQDIDNVTYRGIVKINGFAPDETIEFTINRSGTMINKQTVGYGVIVLGLVFILIAAWVYLRVSSVPESVPIEEETMQSLMKQIAELDDQFEQGAIEKQDYDTQRKSLKNKVALMMKAENQ